MSLGVKIMSPNWTLEVVPAQASLEGNSQPGHSSYVFQGSLFICESAEEHLHVLQQELHRLVVLLPQLLLHGSVSGGLGTCHFAEESQHCIVEVSDTPGRQRMSTLATAGSRWHECEWCLTP
jgi:hypothetical protein